MQPKKRTPETPKIPAKSARRMVAGAGAGSPVHREIHIPDWQPVPRVLLCPFWAPLLISPTLVCAEQVVLTGLLGTLRKGSKLAAEGGVGTRSSPVRSFQGEGDAGFGFPVGLEGRGPLLGAKFWVQHSQLGSSSTIGPPAAHSHEGNSTRSQESTADSEGLGVGGLHLNLHPYFGGPCGIET